MITPHPSAPVGLVQRLPFYRASDFPADSAILCRNSAPLIAFAFNLLRRSVACHVLGRDLAVGLEKLLDKVTGSSKGETLHNLQSYFSKESQRLTSKGKRREAEALADRVECLKIFINGTIGDSVPAVKTKIQSLFKAGPGVTLSTVHKAKGLEWETVFILDKDTLMPSKYATAPWEVQQERNIIYVAVTRAKLNLFYINSGAWKQ